MENSDSAQQQNAAKNSFLDFQSSALPTELSCQTIEAQHLASNLASFLARIFVLLLQSDT
jgi:hypothetical protein